MSHSGNWTSRMLMAWASWGLGAFLILAGIIATFLGLDAGNLITTGAGMITLVVGIIVAGKVAQDTTKKDG